MGTGRVCFGKSLTLSGPPISHLSNEGDDHRILVRLSMIHSSPVVRCSKSL